MKSGVPFLFLHVVRHVRVCMYVCVHACVGEIACSKTQLFSPQKKGGRRHHHRTNERRHPSPLVLRLSCTPIVPIVCFGLVPAVPHGRGRGWMDAYLTCAPCAIALARSLALSLPCARSFALCAVCGVYVCVCPPTQVYTAVSVSFSL